MTAGIKDTRKGTTLPNTVITPKPHAGKQHEVLLSSRDIKIIRNLLIPERDKGLRTNRNKNASSQTANSMTIQRLLQKLPIVN